MRISNRFVIADSSGRIRVLSYHRENHYISRYYAYTLIYTPIDNVLGWISCHEVLFGDFIQRDWVPKLRGNYVFRLFK